MKLHKNPVFLTEKRLVYRSGILAAMLAAALISLSFLSGLISYKINKPLFDFTSTVSAGSFFYGWLVIAQILVLYLMGFSKIVRTVTDERQSGLYDQNRLTPLKPARIAAGYLLGPPLQELYVSIILALSGLLIVLLANLPLKLYLTTQALTYYGALFIWLIALLIGLVGKQTRNVFLISGLLLLFQPWFIGSGKRLIINFLLPTYGIISMFNSISSNTWYILRDNPHIFGFEIPPVILTFCLQGLLGIVLWRVAIRKIKSPSKPLLTWKEAVFIHTMILFTQSGLMWNQSNNLSSSCCSPDYFSGVSVFYAGSLLLGAVLLTVISIDPEFVMRQYLKEGGSKLMLILKNSAVTITPVITIISWLAIVPHISRVINNADLRLGIVFINALSCFMLYAFLVEFARLKFKWHANHYIGLGLFIFFLLPLLLAVTSAFRELSKLSFIVPGILAISGCSPFSSDIDSELRHLFIYCFIEISIVVLMFILWARLWNITLTDRKQ